MSQQHRILIVVTHLLGSGHLSRAMTLARAFLSAGHQVKLLSGGMPAPQLARDDLDLVQLPPLRSDGTDFTRLLDEGGDIAGQDLYRSRIELAVATLHAFQPTCVITELFPFGRRSLKDEFTALLQATQTLTEKPKVYASIRDILAPPRKPRKAVFADDIITQFYDGVLVHSDPDIVPLEQSWPVSDRLRPLLRYTGFVAPPLPEVAGHSYRAEAVIVSAGGGAVGAQLFEAALQVARGDETPWHILVGGHDAAARIAALPKPPSNVLLEPARPDFRQMLQVASASISLCGYNTAMDVLQTGLPAVMVAFDDGAEVEQSLRANALANLPGIATLPLSAVTADGLRAALTRVRGETRARDVGHVFDGARRTVEICLEGAA